MIKLLNNNNSSNNNTGGFFLVNNFIIKKTSSSSYYYYITGKRGWLRLVVPAMPAMSILLVGAAATGALTSLARLLVTESNIGCIDASLQTRPVLPCFGFAAQEVLVYCKYSSYQFFSPALPSLLRFQAVYPSTIFGMVHLQSLVGHHG